MHPRLRHWGKHTGSDRRPTTFPSIWHPPSLSRVVRNHLLTSSFKICHSSEFFGTLGIYSTRFLCGNCPLGFLFQINLSKWILHAVHMSCVLHDHSKRTEDSHHLSFFYSRRERSETMGSETTESSVDYGIYSTRFRCIFSSGFMSFSNWVL